MKYSEYIQNIRKLLEQEGLDYHIDDLQIITNLFFENNIEIEKCFNFYKLIIQTKNLLYRYNLHLVYQPFSDAQTKNDVWEIFEISDGFETKLKVSFHQNYSLMQVEDNLSSLYH